MFLRIQIKCVERYFFIDSQVRISAATHSKFMLVMLDACKRNENIQNEIHLFV